MFAGFIPWNQFYEPQRQQPKRLLQLLQTWTLPGLDTIFMQSQGSNVRSDKECPWQRQESSMSAQPDPSCQRNQVQSQGLENSVFGQILRAANTFTKGMAEFAVDMNKNHFYEQSFSLSQVCLNSGPLHTVLMAKSAETILPIISGTLSIFEDKRRPRGGGSTLYGGLFQEPLLHLSQATESDPLPAHENAQIGQASRQDLHLVAQADGAHWNNDNEKKQSWCKSEEKPCSSKDSFNARDKQSNAHEGLLRTDGSITTGHTIIKARDERGSNEPDGFAANPSSRSSLSSHAHKSSHTDPGMPRSDDVKSFFELQDRDLQGQVVAMDRYKNKVCVVVNVSSKCGLTPRNYTELVLLDQKYRDRGLQILAFPCNQFANQEPGSVEEIEALARGKYGAEFPLFEKGDVNGPNARPVFQYLKEQLPGTFGDFIKWNFTKFLIDHHGRPYKRYGPKENPLSMEQEIQALLAQRAQDLKASDPSS